MIKGHIAKFDGSDSVYYHGFDWYQPSMSHLRKLMRKVYNNYEKYRADALKSSEYIRKEWNWDKSADLIIKKLKELGYLVSERIQDEGGHWIGWLWTIYPIPLREYKKLKDSHPQM